MQASCSPRRAPPRPGPKRAGLAVAVGLTLAALSGAAGAEPGAQATRLPVEGFRPAVVVPPAGPGPRPVVVALHGNFDRPEWSCEVLPELVRGRAWVLCVRGVPRRDVPASAGRWTYRGRARARAEIEAALRALRARYPGRVARAPLLLAGFSLGAIYGARLAVAQPARFPRLYLVEGSYKVWTRRAVRRFVRRGGQAVVFGCGRKGCARATRRLCRRFARAGVSCQVAHAPGLGHSYTAPLPARARPLFDAMVAGDGRWQR